MTTPDSSQTRATLDELGVSEADIEAAMQPVVRQIARMADDQGRDAEEVFLSLDGELFGALAIGYLTAKRAGHTGTDLRRAAARTTAYALISADRPDLVPLAAALGQYVS